MVLLPQIPSYLLSKIAILKMFPSTTMLLSLWIMFYKMDSGKRFFESINIELRYLSPYSPDLNPIEMFFGVLKSRLNSLRPRASTREVLRRNIDLIMTRFQESRESLVLFYRHVWETVDSIVNGQID